MRIFHVIALAAGLALGAASSAQDEPAIRDIEPHPVAQNDDPVNIWVNASTVDGLVIAVTIDGASIRLDSATPARVPRAAASRGADRAGDQVTAVGFAGGAKVSEISVPDQVLNAEEGVGLVRVTKRQIVLSLPAPRAIDTVEITAPATAATGRFDVSGAYAIYCKGDRPDPRYCPPKTGGEPGN